MSQVLVALMMFFFQKALKLFRHVILSEVAFTLVHFMLYSSSFHLKINIFAPLKRHNLLHKTDQQLMFKTFFGGNLENQDFPQS